MNRYCQHFFFRMESTLPKLLLYLFDTLSYDYLGICDGQYEHTNIEDIESRDPRMEDHCNEKQSQSIQDLPEENETFLQSVSDLVNVQLDRAKEKKLLAKLDLHFVPIIMFAYLTFFLDRGNIGIS